MKRSALALTNLLGMLFVLAAACSDRDDAADKEGAAITGDIDGSGGSAGSTEPDSTPAGGQGGTGGAGGSGPSNSAGGAGGSDPGHGTGGDDGNGWEEEGEYTLENVCQRMAKSLCANLEPCCESSDIGYDAIGCEAAAKAECDEKVVKVNEGRLSFNPDAIAPCLVVDERLRESCHFTFFDILASTEEIQATCNRIFEGAFAEGEACERRDDCKHPEDYRRFATCEHGRCVVEVGILVEGEACTKGAPECELGLFCSELSSQCERGILGASCEPMSTHECGSGNYCDSEDEKCKVLKAAGEGCKADIECASEYCDTDGKCAKGTPVANEEACLGR